MLRSKIPDLVMQKFYGLWLAHFAVRRLMHEAALKKDIDPEELLLKRAFQFFAANCPMLRLYSQKKDYATWYDKLIKCLKRAKFASSRGKRNLRVVKRRTSFYPSRLGIELLNMPFNTNIHVKNTIN